MKIQYDDEGRIRCAAADDTQLTGNTLIVPAEELPEDFLSTFALGKYRVEGGRIVQVSGFRRPRRRLDFVPARPGAGSGTKKLRKKASKKKLSRRNP